MRSARTIRDWLDELGLVQHAGAFEREQIDVEALIHLTEENLKDLGLPMGHRVKLLAAIRALAEAPRQTPPPEPQALSPHSYTPKHLAEKILTTRAALEGERKQVTVLFCDIANSTPLAEKLGAESMHGLLRRFFDLALAEVHRYEGTINQFLGDGFMALFGAPLAHEDHARRAVLAALGIRSALSAKQSNLGLPPGTALHIRTGVHTGPVVVGSIGDNLRMDYTAIGDTTNLAARLQQNAQPDQILVSETTARLVRGYIEVLALPPFTVKGKSDPVNALEVKAIGRRRSRLDEARTLSPFVGRDRESGILHEVLAETRAGRGQVVGIVGEPGVGKSRLVYEFRRLLQDAEVSYVEGWCLSFGQAMPYLPLLDLMRLTCDITDADTPAQILDKVRASVARLGLEPNATVPYVLRLLGVLEQEGDQDPLAGLSPETIQARTIEALVRIILAQGRERVLVVTIEDLHWIDKSSEAFVSALVENLAGAPVLLLTTSRPGYSPPWLGKSYVTQLALRVLAPEASRRIIEATVERTDLGALATQSILRKAEGNPLFLEELTLSLREGSSAVTLEHSLPDTIQGVLAARIDRLPEDTKRALQTASVLGREFSSRMLEAISEQMSGLAKHLAVLKHLEFLYERTEAEGPVYTFKHVLTQEVAYDSLLSARKQSLHEAAGAALEALYPERLEERYELLAHHFSRSANVDKAVEYLDLANRKAEKAYAMAEAKAYFDRAMTLLDTMPANAANNRRRVSLLVNQWVVFWLLFQYPDYYELLSRHEKTALGLGDESLLGAFYTRLGHCQWVFGRLEQVLLTATKAAQHCEAAGNIEDASIAYCIMEWTHMHLGNYEQALQWQTHTLRTVKQRFNLRWYSWSLAGASYAYHYLGRWEDAIQEGMKELEIAEQYTDASLIGFAHWILAQAYTAKGDLASGVAHGETAVATAPTTGDKAWAQSILGWAWCRAGQAGKACQMLAELVPMYQATRFIPGEVYTSAFLGEAYWRAGEFQKAREVLEHVIELTTQAGMRFFRGSSHRLLGELAMTTVQDETDVAAAVPHFEEAIGILKQIKAENELALAYAGYGRLLRRLGRIDESGDYLTRALEIFDRLGTLIEPERVRAELSALPTV